MKDFRQEEDFKLERLSRHRFEKEHFDKAILVTGATENHAYHLPMGTDTFAAYGIAEEVARKTPGALLLPPIHFGVSDGLMPYPFTITLTAETLSQVIFEAIESCIEQGISRFMIINGHGGNNSAIDIATRKIRKAYPNAENRSIDGMVDIRPEACPPGVFGEDFGIGHAGEAETSTALYLAPELVDMNIAEGEWPKSPPEIKLFTRIPEISKTGATGDPKNATAEKGQLIVEYLSNYLSKFLIEMDATGWNFVRSNWHQLLK